MVRLRGRIGVAKRVHWLKRYSEFARWGVGLCEGWAGAVELTEMPVTCVECLKRFGKPGFETEFVEKVSDA